MSQPPPRMLAKILQFYTYFILQTSDVMNLSCHLYYNTAKYLQIYSDRASPVCWLLVSGAEFEYLQECFVQLRDQARIALLSSVCRLPEDLY